MPKRKGTRGQRARGSDTDRDFPPPSRLSKRAAEAWREIVARHGRRAARIVGPELEVYCEAIGTAREARARIEAEGMVVADMRGAAIPHPAVAVAAAADKTIERLAPRFQVRVDRGEQGYMVRKTRDAVRGAGLDAKPEYSGMIAAALTLAVVIDHAQEEGHDALRRAAFGPIPSYIKAMKDLGLAPRLGVVEEPDAQDAGTETPVTTINDWMQREA